MNVTLKGYKGKAGGLGLIATGVGMLLMGIKNGNVFEVAAEAIATISLGLGVFGIRVKLDEE